MPHALRPHHQNQGFHVRDRASVHVRACLAVLAVLGCSNTPAATTTDVVDPLLQLDATTTELPSWQNENDVQTGDNSASGDGGVPCPEGGRKGDGTCCPSGLYWDAATSNCLAAGPSGCFPSGKEDPASCVPRWCFAYLDDNHQPCTPGPETCRAVTSPCPANAADIHIGCPAGQAPETSCAPAGDVVLPSATGAIVPWTDGAALPALPSLTLLTGPPALPKPIATPMWCYDGAGALIDATATPSLCVSTACAIGQRPNPAATSACQDVAGPAWTCPPGFVVAGDSCAPDPADCTDPWGGVTPGPNVVFVSASAAAGGTGTQAAPFQNLADAVLALPTGGTIAIGAGSYSGNVSLVQPILLRGACAKDVILQGAAGTPTVLVGEKSGSEVSDVTITGGRYGIQVEGKVQATVQHTYVHSAAQGGIYVVDGATAKVQNTFVYTTLPGDNSTHGRGIDVESGTLDVSNVRLTSNREFGLFGADSTVTVQSLVVDATLAQKSDNKSGYGVYIVGTGALSATELRVSGNRGFGVRIEGKIAASGENWWIDGTLPDGDQKDGIGLGTFTSSVKVTDLRVTNSHQHGIWVVDPGASLSGHNVLVSDTQPQASDSTGGQGVVIEGVGASAQFSGLRVHGSHAHGLSAAGQDAAVGLDFAVIDATQPRVSDKSAGVGMEILDGAKLLLPPAGSVTIAGSYTTGLLLSNGTWSGGTVRVQDTSSTQIDGQGGQGAVIESGSQVSDATLRVANSHDNGIVIVSKTTGVKNAVLEANATLPRTSDGTGGGGVLIAEGANVQASVTATSSRGYGLALDGIGTQLDAKSGVVIGFTQMNADGSGGDGIQILGGAALSATGVRVQNSFGHGIFAYDTGSSLKASHVEVSETQVNSSPAWGRGISISHGAKATLSDVHVESSHDIGLFVADTTTTASIDDLSIDGGKRGIAVQNRAVVTGHRWRLQNHSEIGLLAIDGATRVDVRDLAVHNVGYGIQVANLATARLARVAVAGAQGVGIVVDGSEIGGAASSLDLFDLRVTDVTANAVGAGHGAVAQAGGILRIAGMVAHNWSGVGILSLAGSLDVGGAFLQSATGGGIRAVGTDLKLNGCRTDGVTGVGWSQTGGAALVSECAFLNSKPDDFGNSNGIEITTNSTVTLGRSLVSGMQTAGVVLVHSSLTADDVRVSGNGEGLSRENGASDTWVRSLFFGNSSGDVVDPGDIAPSSIPGDVVVLDGSDSP